MKKLLVLLLLLPTLAFAQVALEKLAQFDSARVYDSVAVDVVVLTFSQAEKYDEIYRVVKCDTTALDSINFYHVLEYSWGGSTWFPVESTQVTTVAYSAVRTGNIMAPYWRIRINGIGNSGVPKTPISVMTLARKKAF